MPSRRPHAKTRFGCLPCKRARIKCDENQPQCANCVRLKRQCEYLGRPRAPLNVAFPDISQASASPSIRPHSPPQHGPEVTRVAETSFNDLHLMHIYSVSTCITLDPRPELLHVWQVVVPREAVTHPYLMHSLLAMAALHQLFMATNITHHSMSASDEVSSHYLPLAMHHHSQALALSKPDLETVNERNCHALFAFSAMIAVSSLALAMCRAGPSTSLVDPIGEIAQTAMLMRGSKTIVQSSHSCLKNGKVGPLLRYGFMPKHTALPEDVTVALQGINGCIEQLKDEKEQETCVAALDGLKTCFYTTDISKGSGLSVRLEDKGVIFGWLATIEMDFISLLFSRQPVALVILAYFAIFVHSLDEVWWYKGWGSALIHAVVETLKETWEPALRWVKHQFRCSRSP